jgi:hypothetical protein
MSFPVGMFVDDRDIVPTHCSGLMGYDDVATSDEELFVDEVPFVEDVVAASALASLAAGVLSVLFFASVVAPSVLADVSAVWDLLPDRESVLYHPEPLKTIPAGWKIRRMDAPHSGHVVRGVSENF